MSESKAAALPRGVQWTFELMAMIYLAVMVLFLVNPDWIILWTNKLFDRFDWPAVFFPTERFWFSLAVSVPGTRAFLAFAAARKPTLARFCVTVLQISLLLAATLFAWQFVFHKHAPLYLLGVVVQASEMALYAFLCRWLP